MATDATPPARLLTCERSPAWAALLRLSLASNQTVVYETRSLAECEEELVRSGASFVVVEVRRENLNVLPSWLLRNTQAGRVRAAVVGERSLAATEPLLREAGAVHAVFSPRKIDPLVALALRHLALSPQPSFNVRENVWRRLPWPEAASSSF